MGFLFQKVVGKIKFWKYLVSICFTKRNCCSVCVKYQTNSILKCQKVKIKFECKVLLELCNIYSWTVVSLDL